MLSLLPHASSIESYEGIIESARTVKTKKPFAKQAQLVQYVDERFRQENLVVPINIARADPFVRYGQSTNNPCEQFFSSMKKHFDLPLPLMLDKIIAHTMGWRVEQSRVAAERVAEAAAKPEQMRLHITPHAVQEVEAFIAKSSAYKVTHQELTATRLSARVTHKERKTSHDVVIVLADGAATVTCCAMLTELARPCKHVVAAIVRVPREHAEAWSVFDVRFFGHVWRTATWRAQLSSVPVAVDIPNAGLTNDETVRPWRRIVKVRSFFLFDSSTMTTVALQVGRPKEPTRKALRPDVKHKRCKGCDELGHNLKTCVKIDLDLVYAKLSSGRSNDDGPDSDDDGSSASSDEAEVHHEAEIAEAAADLPERKRSRSHELAMVAREASNGAGGRRTRRGQ